jgi:SMC interacting uncharacterized protein involved in chromosome segregation
MEEKTTLQRLGEKVAQMLQQYDALRSENEMLRNEVVTLKAESEAKTSQIGRMEEELVQKEREIEEIVNKIESILG